ncbi:MAG: hypothetical protein ACREXY_09305, partial [Gammaproteobacteria bacterium]
MAGRKTVVVRKHLPQAVAEQLKVSLETRGLVCTLVAPLGLVAREISVEKKEYVCPACDHRQPYTDAQDDAPCANCGVIRSKYLKNEKTRKAIERERRLREIKKQNEIEHDLRDEDGREKEQIEAKVRQQLGRERRLGRITRVAERCRRISIPTRIATGLLLMCVVSAVYLVGANDAKNDDTKLASEQVPTVVAVDRDGAADRSTSGQPTAGPGGKNDSGSGMPTTVPLGVESGVDSKVVIHLSSGDGKASPSRDVDAMSDTTNAEGVTAGSFGTGAARADQSDSNRSTVTTALTDEAGGIAGSTPDASPLGSAEGSTVTPGKAGSSPAPAAVVAGGSAGMRSFEEESGWRGTMNHALIVANGIGDASERAKSLGVLASVYTEMGDTKAAEHTLTEAMEAATSSDVTRNLGGALGKIAKARSELWAVRALSRRNGEWDGSVPEGVTTAIETARGIQRVGDRAAGLSNIAKYLALAGQASQAETLFREALSAAGAMTNATETINLRADVSVDLVEAGDMESARRLPDRMWADAVRIADVPERAEALSAIAATVSAREEGMVRAEELLTEAYRLGEKIADSAERTRVREAIDLQRAQSLSRRAGVLAAAGRDN